MRTFERRSIPITADADGIAEAQTLAQGGDLDLDGAAVVSDLHSPYNGKALLDPPRRVVITSAGDDSGITFTIEGTDRAGTPISETIEGTNGSDATSTMVYKTVDRVSASGATADDVTVGWGAEYISPWIFLGQARGDYRASWQLDVTGTVDCDIEATYRNILRERVKGDYDPTVKDVATTQAADATGDLDIVAAVRLVQNSGAGSAVLRVVTSRI